MGLLDTVLMAKNLQLQDNQLTLYRNRINMLPSRIISLIKRDSDQLAKYPILYHSSRIEGYTWFRSMIENGFVRNIDEVTELGIEILGLAGWGKFQILQFDKTKKNIRIRVDNSAEATSYIDQFGGSSQPVCDVVRGFFAGGYSLPLFTSDLEFIEEACYCQNKTNCLLLGRPRKDLDLSNPSISAQIGSEAVELDLSFIKKSK